MNYLKNRRHGFTIVELLLVIVIIAILAAITIVSYTGISSRATVSSLQSDLTNAVTQLKLDQVNSSSSSFPTTLALANGGKGIPSSSGTSYTYAVSNTTTPPTFCITATKNNISYNITQDGNSQPGICPVLNLDAGNISSYPGTGTTWTDLSGNGNSGTLVGGVTYSSANGGVLSFDGSTGYVEVPHSATTDVNQLSICLWVQTPTIMGVTFRAFFSKQGVDRDYNFYAYSPTSSNITNLHFSSARFGGNILALPVAYSPNSWHFVSVTVSTTGLQSYYSDGALIGTSQGTAGSANSNYPIWVGKADNLWQGMIGEVSMYNVALSANDILQNFNNLRSRYGI